GFVRRKKTTLWFVGALLVVSASILTVGLAATTRTENVTVGGYYPGIIVSHFQNILGVLGPREDVLHVGVGACDTFFPESVQLMCCSHHSPGSLMGRPRPQVGGHCSMSALG
ncbi:hypothetical protein FD754_024568, partial [Muntiacus muntjak]